MSNLEISFEEYYVDVEEIPYYNFLTSEEREYLEEKYNRYLERSENNVGTIL